MMRQRGMPGHREKRNRLLRNQIHERQQAMLRKRRPTTFLQINPLTRFESCEKRSGLDPRKGKSRQMDRSTWRSAPFLRCRIIAAEHNDSLIPDYQKNPLIEALPPIWEKEQEIDMLQGYLDCQEAYRQCPPELRLHFIRNVTKSFEIIP